MVEEIKKQWIDALRSGEYKQGKAKLVTGDNRYCCLGVLTELYCKDTNSSWNEAIAEPNNDLQSKNHELIHSKVQKWAGLKEGNPLYLSDLNDFEGYSFKDIANLIEDKL